MKRINQILLGIMIIWVSLAILFEFYDLTISKLAIEYKGSQWAQMGEDYGASFRKPLFYLGITILLGNIFDKMKSQKMMGFVILSYMIFYLYFGMLTLDDDKITEATLTILVLSVFMILTYNKNWRNYITLGISLILLILFLELLVNIMKFSWGRVRFNNLSSESEFTEWYIINGNGSDNSHQSFPSGHTAAAWSFLPILFLLKEREIKQRNKFAISIFVISFGLFVAISRVLAGEHYASDVLFSTGIASVITIFLYKTLNRLEQNINKKKQILLKKPISLKYSDLVNQWVGSFLNENGMKSFVWFETYEDAINFSSISNLIMKNT